MLSERDRDFIRESERGIQSARRCAPGSFYLIHRLGVSESDPFTGEEDYSEEREYVEPVVEVMKGDEREVVPSGILSQGDIICTFEDADGLDLDDVRQVVYGGETYRVARHYNKGLGEMYSRKQLFCSKET